MTGRCPPLTQERQHLVDRINRRPGCIAFLTGHRAVENYLHGEALAEVSGPMVEPGFEDDVPELLARMILSLNGAPGWDRLSRRGRSRLRNRVKKWLNSVAVDRMTPARLAERDSHGDVVRWLQAIGRLSRAAAASASSAEVAPILGPCSGDMAFSLERWPLFCCFALSRHKR